MSRKFTRGLTALVLGACTVTAFAQGQDGRNRLTNPVFRVAKNNGNERPASKEHPLDPAIKRAESGLQHIRKNVADYECMLVARERVNGKLGEHKYMYTKIRNRKVSKALTSRSTL